MEVKSHVMNETGPNLQNNSDIFVAEDVKVSSVVENSEGPSHNGLENHENRDVPPETALMHPDNGRLELMDKDVSGNAGQLEHEDSGTPYQAKNSKVKQKIPLTSSRVLRSKSQEKQKPPEPSVTAKQDSDDREKKSERRKKKPMVKKSVDELSKTKARLAYLLQRIKYEQSLIDAYSAEGWKGQSLEKLKPEKELQRAKSHILSYKLRIRELFQQLEASLDVGKIPESLFDSEGEIESEDIFCAKCGSKELTLDNDIILCDGFCERGFHQFCLEPPLLKEDVPPGDESWLCPGCDCKDYCIDMLRDYQGIDVSISDNWEKVFPEAAASASGKKPDDNSASSSDDSEDDDYDPNKPDTVEEVEANKSNSASDNLAASPNFENNVELTSDNSEDDDDDFDPTAPDPDKQETQDSSTSDFTSDSEDLQALLDDATGPSYDDEHTSIALDNNQPYQSSIEENSKVGKMQKQSLKSELAYLVESLDETVSGKRQRERLDYKKLHNETYGHSSSDSSDEDYEEDTTASKKKKNNREKTEVILPNKIPSAKSEMDTKDGNQKVGCDLVNETPKVNAADGSAKESTTPVISASTKKRKPSRKKTELISPDKTPITKSGIDTKDENQKDSCDLVNGTPKVNAADGSAKESTTPVNSASTKKRKPSRKKTELISPDKTPITESEMDTKDENQKESCDLVNGTPKVNAADGSAKESATPVNSASTKKKKTSRKKTELFSPNKSPITKSGIDTKDENQKESCDLANGTPKVNAAEGNAKESANSASTKKKKITREKAELISPNKTPFKKSEIDIKDGNQKERFDSPKRTLRSTAGGSAKKSPTTVNSVSTNTNKSTPRRLGEAATQRLYQSFNEKQYPDKTEQEKLANELDLTTKQVSKWFENARWSFRHKQQMETLAANISGGNSKKLESKKRKR